MIRIVSGRATGGSSDARGRGDANVRQFSLSLNLLQNLKLVVFLERTAQIAGNLRMDDNRVLSL